MRKDISMSRLIYGRLRSRAADRIGHTANWPAVVLPTRHAGHLSGLYLRLRDRAVYVAIVPKCAA